MFYLFLHTCTGRIYISASDKQVHFTYQGNVRHQFEEEQQIYNTANSVEGTFLLYFIN